VLSILESPGSWPLPVSDPIKIKFRTTFPAAVNIFALYEMQDGKRNFVRIAPEFICDPKEVQYLSARIANDAVPHFHGLLLSVELKEAQAAHYVTSSEMRLMSDESDHEKEPLAGSLRVPRCCFALPERSL
jgi:hypothetical protein